MNRKTWFAAAAVAVCATPALASTIVPPVVAGNGYTIISAVGGAGGFASSLTAPTDSVVNNGTEPNGTDLFGASVFSTDTLLDNGGGEFDFILTLSGGDLSPGGFSVGGLPADTAALFVGAAAGGDPIALNEHTVNFVTLETFAADGASLSGGPMDVSGLSFFSAGPGGGWDGNFGFTLGAGSAGTGISSFVLRVNLSVPGAAVPEPASGMLVISLFAGARQRRPRE